MITKFKADFSEKDDDYDFDTEKTIPELTVIPSNETTLNKTKDNYGIIREIKTSSGMGPASVNIPGKYIVFIKFQKLILDCNNIYKKLGFVKENETASRYTDSQRDYVRKYSEATRQGLCGEVEFILIPQDPKQVYPPFGLKYKTYIPFSHSILLNSIADLFKTNNWVFNGKGYKIKPGSIKERKSKGTTSTFG